MSAKGPIIFDLEDVADIPSPDAAPPVPDTTEHRGEGQAMQMVTTLASRSPSRLARWFWGLLVALVSTLVSLAAWNYAVTLLNSNPILGMIVAALILAFVVVLLIIALRELAAFARLRRVDSIQHHATEVLASGDLHEARGVIRNLARLYRGREDTKWGREAVNDRQGDQFDAEALIGLAEREILGPLDHLATQEIEAAARQVATVTALVPLAMADVVAALTANIRMIRRIAEIYGGRSGTLGSWRLTRAVMTHLVATGAVAVGDDMLEPIIGGGLLGKLSRRFGEGMVNGALTARVGIAALEVCRPLPFSTLKQPSTRAVVQRALAGVFKSGS